MKKLFNIQILLGLFFCMTSHAQSNHERDFDFWIGEWVVYQNGTDKIAGYSRIETILDGKAIQEHYSTASGNYRGTSLNKYNAAESRWEQYWIDNSGLTLHISGGLQDGKMMLSNSQSVNGVVTENRISWTPQEDGSVRQLWEQKQINQVDWQVAFDGIYKAKK